MTTLPRAEMWACRRLKVSSCGHDGKWARVQVAFVDLSTRGHASREDVSAQRRAKRQGRRRNSGVKGSRADTWRPSWWRGTTPEEL